MKKLNEFISYIEKYIPTAYCEIKDLGKGFYVQVIMSSTSNKNISVKESATTGIYVNDIVKTSEGNDIQLIEILYDNNGDKKRFSRQLVDELTKIFANKYIFCNVLSEGKEELRMQFMVLEEIKPFTGWLSTTDYKSSL
jgi:hypothetical protein